MGKPISNPTQSMPHFLHFIDHGAMDFAALPLIIPSFEWLLRIYPGFRVSQMKLSFPNMGPMGMPRTIRRTPEGVNLAIL